MMMKTLAVMGIAAVLTGCTTVKPEVRMIPTGDYGAGVRFSRGNAAMVSNGASGSLRIVHDIDCAAS